MPSGWLYFGQSSFGSNRNPSLGLVSNTIALLDNQYTPGSGVGGVNTSNRRAMLRRATNCTLNSCIHKSNK